MTSLFQPFKLKDITLRNRIAVSPVCQYSAKDGFANRWHQVHLAGLARGGSGLVVVEATDVSPDGRITPCCLGLWSDAQAEVLAPIAQSIRATGAVPGIQIAHAGRKASANVPWEGDDHIAENDPRAGGRLDHLRLRLVVIFPAFRTRWTCPISHGFNRALLIRPARSRSWF